MSRVSDWIITVKTANTPAAGLEAGVFIKLYGDGGASRPIELHDKEKRGNHFSRGVISKFVSSTTEDIGILNEIDVWHTSPQAEWDCEYIQIQRGNDFWTFKPTARILSMKNQEDPSRPPQPTRLKGTRSQSSNGATPFHIAAKEGNVQAIEQFLSKEEFSVNQTDEMGRTAAHYAVMYGQKEVLSKLITFKADLGQRDKLGKHVLHHACVNELNNEEIVRILLSNAPDFTESRDNKSRKERTFRFILSQDYFGKSAMHYAATYDFVPLIDLLYKNCPQAIEAQDNTQQTPLHCAAIRGSRRAAIALLRHGAAPEAKDAELRTFLHHAATAGHHALIVDALEEAGDLGKESLLKARDKAQRTPLMCAVADGGLQTAEALCNAGADINHMDEHKSTCMHHAAKKGDEKLLNWLVLKLSINDKNALGLTPLHVAVDHNNFRAVRWLLKNGADVTARTSFNETTLELAEKRAVSRNSEMVRIIREATNAAQQEAKSAEGGGGSGGEPEAGLSLDTTDVDDNHPFYGTKNRRAASEEDNSLLEEIARLKQEVLALKDKVHKKNQVIEILKKKLGLSKEEVDKIEEEVGMGRMCQQPECQVM